MDTPIMTDAPRIAVVGKIYPLVDAWQPNDDWTGVTSSAERKRRQNRINQRALRRRRNAEKFNQLEQSSPSSSEDTIAKCTNDVTDSLYLSYEMVPVASGRVMPVPDGPVVLTCPRQIAHARHLMRQAYEDYTLGAPRPSNLPILIKLNVLNALVQNTILLGVPPEGLCQDEFISAFNEVGPYPPHHPKALTSCPKALMPTDIQRKIIHHPWIDMFPFPQFRDNVLLAVEAGLFDEDELCLDILDVGTQSSQSIIENPALIVWGDAPDFRGWEANAPFLRKWGWLLRGCPELIEGTNYWREKRGEKRIVFEVSEA
ncbi:hypothetical protein BDV96DRAFT_654603 [Lophiotrema nucula]|uniref:BZIP domain-containing protein n=1 Tax=Lophiotrema nucula TaxID=690887 RepID=A0A6A5YK70_9PLEO|nr:hypothetical protein BDV96DRAFT_654603 [Lophiotrema nucula]